MILKPESREEWLAARINGIGGSDAGAVLGCNKYRTNVEVYREKAGIITPEDISDKPAVYFGKNAEEHIRALFQLNHPEYKVNYHEFWMYQHEKYNYMYATLDGELQDNAGRRGILEIKTVTIQNNNQWEEWTEQVPQSYYCQLLHQLACTGWDFAILTAYIRYYHAGELRATIREYTTTREENIKEINYLIAKEADFWRNVQERREPPQILPQI